MYVSTNAWMIHYDKISVLLGPMAHQMAQEGVHWPSSTIRLGPQWRNSKIIWANIVHAVLDVDT